MSKSRNKNSKVFFRIFPLEKIHWEYLKIKENIIYMKCLQDSNQGRKKCPPKFWEFKTDGVFLNSNQDYLYSEVIEGVLDRIIEGYNGIVAAFGQTGTGKSITVGGLQLSQDDFGITPRVIFDLFKLKSELPKNIKMCIQISYIELSKPTVVDLLKEFPNSMEAYHYKEATKIKVTTEYDALKLLYRGEGRKTFAMNSEYMSHISTTVITFHITTVNLDFTSSEKKFSRLHIIDLAGIDTVGNLSSNYKNPADIGKANIIKTELEQFVLFLMENIPDHIRVKERANPLIYFLGSDLSKESILRFIGHIRIQKEDLLITISLLRFGQLIRGLKPKKKEMPPEINEESKMAFIQNKLELLQKEQMHSSVLLNQDLTQNLNQDRMEHIQRTIQEYLQDQITEINILNVADASEVFKALKNMCIQCEEDKMRICNEAQLDLFGKPKRDSKTSSKTSIRGPRGSSSRRPSKKATPEKLVKPGRSISGQSLGSKRSSAQHKSGKKSPMASSQQIGKKRSSMGKQRSSLSRRKSNTSASITDKKDSKSYASLVILVPDIVPEYQEAWGIFVNDNESSYKSLLEAYINNEKDVQSVYCDYLTEMAKLQSCKEILEKRKFEIFEAQMIRKFTVDGLHASSEELVTENDRVCQDNLQAAENSLLEQQEVALRWQAELKICLLNRRDIKKQVTEDFDLYCKEKYTVPIPNMSSEDVLVDETVAIDLQALEKEEKEKEDNSKCVDKSKEVIEIEALKKIMEKELRKNIKLKAIKKRKWKNYALKT